MIVKQKIIGVVLIIFAVLLSTVFISNEIYEEKLINEIMDNSGSCFLDDGTCLHKSKLSFLDIMGWLVAILLFLFGILLLVFNKIDLKIYETNKATAIALKEAEEKNAFRAFLSGFSNEEKDVLRAIYNQDGITQSTLRFKTNMSKASVSLVLKDLESKGIISRKEHGKTKKVFLVQKF